MHTIAHSRVLTRRTALRSAAATAIGALAVTSLTACSDGNEAVEVDRLTSAATLARRDAENATAAIALLPDHSRALTTISTQRGEHATALEAEIARAAGHYADDSAPTTSASPTSGQPAPPPNIDTLRRQLSESQRNATDLARSLSGYRAGLCASIGAACGSHLAVLLP